MGEERSDLIADQVASAELARDTIHAYSAPLLPRSTGSTGDARRGERVGLETQREHKPNTMLCSPFQKARWRVPCQQVVPSTVTIEHVSLRGAAFPEFSQNLFEDHRMVLEDHRMVLNSWENWTGG